MAIYHAYTQTVADGTATSVVRPSDWNSGHVQGFFLAGNTGGTSSVTGTDVYFSGGNGVTLSGSNNSIGFHVNTAPDQISIVGNTAGTGATFTGDNFYFFGGSNITLSNSASSVRFDAAMNFSAANGSGSASQLVFNNANGVSFSTGAGGISASVAGGAGPTLSFFANPVSGASSVLSVTGGNAIIQPFVAPNNIAVYQARVMQSASQPSPGIGASASISAGNANSYTNTFGLTQSAWLLSRLSTGTDANSSVLVSYWSGIQTHSVGLYQSVSWSTNAGSATVSVTYSTALGIVNNIGSNGAITTTAIGTSGSFSFSSNSTNVNSFSSSSSISGMAGSYSNIRPFIIAMNTTIPAGENWFAVAVTTTAGSTGSNNSAYVMQSVSRLGFTASTLAYLEYGNTIISTSNNQQFWGTVASSVLTGSVRQSNVSSASNFQLWFNMQAATK